MRDDEPIKKTYRDVEIVYVERDDKWNFTVNGRERNSESLMKAKESIDRALDVERKERPWKPFVAYFYRYSNEFEVVTVTSQADGGYGSSIYFWIKNSKDKRSKEPQNCLYAKSPENDQKIARWRELDAEITRLETERHDLVSKMEQIKAPAAVESAAG